MHNMSTTNFQSGTIKSVCLSSEMDSSQLRGQVLDPYSLSVPGHKPTSPQCCVCWTVYHGCFLPAQLIVSHLGLNVSVVTPASGALDVVCELCDMTGHLVFLPAPVRREQPPLYPAVCPSSLTGLWILHYASVKEIQLVKGRNPQIISLLPATGGSQLLHDFTSIAGFK